MRRQGAEHPVVARKSVKADGAKWVCVVKRHRFGQPARGGAGKDEAKPFCISGWEVWEAWLKVKSNGGAAGLDGQSIEEFERDL
jgi:hypothetical protein